MEYLREKWTEQDYRLVNGVISEEHLSSKTFQTILKLTINLRNLETILIFR